MSTLQTVILGAVAGFTIFVGLPMGRVRHQSKALKTFLNGVSAGILIFLLFDILAQAIEPLDALAAAAHEGAPDWGRFAGLAAVFSPTPGTPGMLSDVSPLRAT